MKFILTIFDCKTIVYIDKNCSCTTFTVWVAADGGGIRTGPSLSLFFSKKIWRTTSVFFLNSKSLLQTIIYHTPFDVKVEAWEVVCNCHDFVCPSLLLRAMLPLRISLCNHTGKDAVALDHTDFYRTPEAAMAGHFICRGNSRGPHWSTRHQFNERYQIRSCERGHQVCLGQL